jgi:N6-adenosine-specific RNA methylase IME4
MIVKLCGDLPRLEMFSRTQTPGWEIWGNQSTKFKPTLPDQKDEARL